MGKNGSPRCEHRKQTNNNKNKGSRPCFPLINLTDVFSFSHLHPVIFFFLVILFFCQDGIGQEEPRSVAEDRRAGEIAKDPGLQTAQYSVSVIDAPRGCQMQTQ